MSRYGCLILLTRSRTYLITKVLICVKFRSLPFKWETGLIIYNKDVMLQFSTKLHINIKYEDGFSVYSTYDAREISILIIYKRFRYKIRISTNDWTISPYSAIKTIQPILRRFKLNTIGSLYKFVNVAGLACIAHL